MTIPPNWNGPLNVVAGIAIGWAVRSICWIRTLDKRISQLERCVVMILDHGFNIPKDWRTLIGWRNYADKKP